MIQIKRSDRLNLLLFLLAVVACGIAVYVGLRIAIDSAGKIFVAVITGIFGLLVAYVTHAFNVQRERYVEQQRRMQERYAGVLQALAPYVRTRGNESDAFATAALQAYVVGSPEVADAIRRFVETRKTDALDEVVWSMRMDLGMRPLDDVTTTRPLLGPAKTEEPPGALQ